jgi:deoxyribonuclease-4
VTAVGAHTFGFVWQAEAEAAIGAIAEAGFAAVQLMAAPPHFDPWQDDAARTRRLRALLERHRLPLLALDLASSDINLASASPDVTAFAVEAYRRMIDRAAELGAPAICIGSGRRHALLSKANDRLMETFRPAFARIHRHGETRGVRLLLENHPQGLLASAAQMQAFLASEGYADIGIIYDVANAAAIGEDPVAGIARLAPAIALLHLSDAPAGQWRHDAIGAGDIDFDAIAGATRTPGFAGQVVLEILSDDPLARLTDGIAALNRRGWSLSLHPRPTA